MSNDVVIAGGIGAAPQVYEVPNATEIVVRCVTATFDGSAAATFVPTIEIVSDGGVVIARVPADTTVSAGGSAEVTFAPFLRTVTTGGGGSGITEIDSSDNSINVAGSMGPVTDLTAFRPQFSQNTGTVTFAGPGAANVPWTFFLGDNFLDYTTPTVPAPLFSGWYQFSAFATFGPLAAPYSSGDGTLTASGGYAPSPSSEAGGLGSSTFGLALAWSLPPLRMKTTGGVVLGVDTDSATGCVVNAQLNVAWLRPD